MAKYRIVEVKEKHRSPRYCVQRYKNWFLGLATCVYFRYGMVATYAIFDTIEEAKDFIETDKNEKEGRKVVYTE